jgi:hypothetical protein fulcA4_08339
MQITATYNGYYPTQTNFQGIKITPTTKQWNELRVFSHHIYEYKKGLRSLILTTEKEANRKIITDRLERENISYLIQNVDEKKINVFFGNPDSINVIKSFNQPKLNEYTPEQDFILGTLLGYDKIQQCQRYLKMNQKKIK